MPFNGLQEYIDLLISEDELIIVNEFVDPVLEVTELTDRIVKSEGKALLFTNTGTDYPIIINMFGSERRMCLAIGRNNLEEAGKDVEELFGALNSGGGGGMLSMLSMLPKLKGLGSYMPSRKNRRGTCQQLIYKAPDLAKLPVLLCWPHDGGRFITLPVVHTKHPDTGEVNAGMYRMQVFDNTTTGMHWHRHKTGAAHYEAWKTSGKRMPVSVVLGGDPVYTYAATAPLPQGIDEYILAGFLRKKKVKLVKCITNDLYVPEDADFVIEGYVDPAEDMIWEGPFGDHTGFYSLADWFPAFHVTCISSRKNPVYPATIVGIPPQEDAWIGLATEKLFLAPLKLAIQPEIIDFHMPPSGVAHNLVLVKIIKKYPGQGKKVISSLFGAGQMMFSKYIIVVSDDIELTDYEKLALTIFSATDFKRDLIFLKGPLDILDHSSDTYSYGGKLGIDATVKLPEEFEADNKEELIISDKKLKLDDHPGLTGIYDMLTEKGIPLILTSIDKDLFNRDDFIERAIIHRRQLVFLLDPGVNLSDLYTSSWQILSNTDPTRDIFYNPKGGIIVDATSKTHPSDKFPRDWPNVVVSDDSTICRIDELTDIGGNITLPESPSSKYNSLVLPGKASVDI